MKPQPKLSEVLRAAASVRGARSMAVETAATAAAPELLEAAEITLRGMSAHADSLEPSAPDQARELAWSRAVAAASEYRSAVDDLRAALGLETHAETLAREEAARQASARSEQERREAEEAAHAAREAEETAAKEAAEWAEDFARALESTVSRYCGVPYDQYGKRVAVIIQRRLAVVGSEAWGDVETVEASREAVLTSEGGRVLAPGEFVAVQGQGDWVAYGDRLRAAGLNGTPKTPATSEWLPVPAKRPRQYKNEWDAEGAWGEAFRAEKAETAKAPAPAPEAKADVPKFKNSPFAALAKIGK